MRMAWIMGCMITNGGVCCNPSRPRGARRLARRARLARLARLVSGTLPSPCRAVSHGQPRLACHCHFAARRPASSRYQRPHAPPPQPSHHSTIPRRHAMIQAIMLRLTPLDAGALAPRTSNLEPRTPPACRNALLPSVHLAVRLLPSAPAASGAACVCITPNAATRFRRASPMDPLSHTPTSPCLGRQLHASLGRLPLRAKSPAPLCVAAILAFHADCDGFPCIYMHALIFTLAATAHPRTYTGEHVRPAQPARVHNLALETGPRRSHPITITDDIYIPSHVNPTCTAWHP
jgi:hypothetical protein